MEARFHNIDYAHTCSSTKPRKGAAIAVAKEADSCYASKITDFSAFGTWNSDHRRAFGLAPFTGRRALACAFSGLAEEPGFSSSVIVIDDLLGNTSRHTMSKGKDFRGPKKRGFDDDGPAPYDSARARQPRTGGAMAAGAPLDSAPVGPAVDAVVKWFKGEKGFGFVELSDGAGDAFLHIGILHAAGYETVPPGAKLKVNVGAGLKGAQVTRVLEVDTTGAAERAPSTRGFGDLHRPQRRAPDPSTAVSVTGTVKWFDDHKGFGFVQSNDGGKDVFVHISILGPAGIQSLTEGQPVTMQVVDTPKGREALSITLG
jgi:cold shock protein